MLPLTSSLVSPYVFVYLRISEKSEVIFVHQNLISNRLTYLVHAKSTGEIISFGFSDRSVRSLVSTKRSANHWVQTKKKQLHFLADLWSQSEFRTQQKTNPKCEMTHCLKPNNLQYMQQYCSSLLYRVTDRHGRLQYTLCSEKNNHSCFFLHNS